MTSKELELLETLAAISRVSKDLALKLAVMAVKADAAEKKRSRRDSSICCRLCRCRKEARHA